MLLLFSLWGVVSMTGTYSMMIPPTHSVSTKGGEIGAGAKMPWPNTVEIHGRNPWYHAADKLHGTCQPGDVLLLNQQLW